MHACSDLQEPQGHVIAHPKIRLFLFNSKGRQDNGLTILMCFKFPASVQFQGIQPNKRLINLAMQSCACSVAPFACVSATIRKSAKFYLDQQEFSFQIRLAFCAVTDNHKRIVYKSDLSACLAVCPCTWKTKQVKLKFLTGVK